MYIGEYSCKIDDKNRFVIPSKFRSEGSKLIISFIDEDTIIVVNSFNQYDSIFSKLDDDIKSKMIKYIGMNSINVSLDSNGRVTIPVSRVTFKEAMVVGRDAYFIICNKEKYLEEKRRIEEEANKFLESSEGKEFTKGLVFGK